MSNKNNVNKDFYTLAGRDRPNEHVVEATTKHLPDELPGHRGDARPNFIPGAAPVGKAPAKAGPKLGAPAVARRSTRRAA